MAAQRRRYRERLPPERELERPLGDLLPRGIELGHAEIGELAPLLAWHLHLDHRRRGPIAHRDGDAFRRRAAARALPRARRAEQPLRDAPAHPCRAWLGRSPPR